MAWLRDNWHWIAIILLAIYGVNQYTALQNEREIGRVTQERDKLRGQYEQIQETVTGLQGKIVVLQADLSAKQQQVEQHKAEVARLETERAEAQLSVRMLRTEDALLDSFRETYPAVSRARNLGIIDIEDNGITLPYLVLPAWFAETFIIENQNLGTAQQQLAEYRELEAAYGAIVSLHEQVLALEQEKSTAYRAGYEEAFTRYERLNTDYVAELRKPRIDLGNKFAWLGGAALGAGACLGVKYAFD